MRDLDSIAQQVDTIEKILSSLLDTVKLLIETVGDIDDEIHEMRQHTP